MPRIIGPSNNFWFNRVNHKKALLLFLVGQATIPAWGVQRDLDSTKIEAHYYSNYLGANTITYTTIGLGEVLLCTFTPPGDSLNLINAGGGSFYGVDTYVPSTAFNITSGVDSAITAGASSLNNGYEINIYADSTFSSSSSAGVINMASSGGGTVTVNNAGTISHTSGGTAINFVGSGSSLFLHNHKNITGDILGGNHGDNIILYNNSAIDGNIVGGSGVNTLTLNKSLTSSKTISNFNITNNAPYTFTVSDVGIVSGDTSKISNNGTLNIEGLVSTKITNLNSGVLNLKTGGTASGPITFGTGGGVINFSGGSATSTITGHSTNNEIINILADCDTASKLSQVTNVGNIFVNTNNFTVNSPLTGVSHNFATAYNTATIISGDLSGGGAISNAGTLNIAGGTIGGSVPMGNTINSGTITVSGDIRIREFTNGIVEPPGQGPLTAIETININYNSTGALGGSFSAAPGVNLPQDQPPTETINNNPIYIKSTDAGSHDPLNLYTKTSLAIQDADGVLNRTVILMAHNGKLDFSTPPGITFTGAGTSTITATGSTIDINAALQNLRFTPSFTEYGTGSVTVVVNDNDLIGSSTTAQNVNASADSTNSGILNITSNNMITNNVNNRLGSINIVGGDLSAFTPNTNIITNNPGQTITVSETGSIGKNAAFNAIRNYGTLNVDGAGATVKTNGIEVNNHGEIITSGVINAPITLNTNSFLQNTTGMTDVYAPSVRITGGAINGIIKDNLVVPTSTDLMVINNIESYVYVSGPFTTTYPIEQIKTISVEMDDTHIGNFTINNPVTKLSELFTFAGTTTTVNADLGGKITGVTANTLAITNAGTLTLGNSVATSAATSANLDVLGTSTLPTGAVTNTGTVNINAGKAYVSDFTNNAPGGVLNIAGGNLRTQDITNTVGRINVSSGDLYASNNNKTITNAAGQTITVSETGTIGQNQAFQTVNNNGTFNAGGGNVTIGTLNNNTLSLGAAVVSFNVTNGIVKTGEINNNKYGIINISNGDLSSAVSSSIPSINNYAGGVINVTGAGTIGANGGLYTIYNPGAINFNGGNIILKDIDNYHTMTASDISVVNVNLSNVDNVATVDTITNGLVTIGSVGHVNIIKGQVQTNNLNNNLGSLNVSGGDISSASSNPCPVLNEANQYINISETGTMGATRALGAVTNKGIFNADGGNVTVGTFTNNHASAALNVTKSIIKTGDITNTNGSINVSAGDVSSVGVTPSTLLNAAGKNINLSGTGTLGATAPLGIITNNGNLNVNSGSSSINATGILLNDGSTMKTIGIINAPITFGTGTVDLSIGGGVINNPITGAGGSNVGTVKITGTFTATNAITNINNLNITNDVNGIGNFTINKSITVTDSITNDSILNITGTDTIVTAPGGINLSSGSSTITSGIINSPINFNGGTGNLTISGGVINNQINGSFSNSSPGGVININGDFTATNNINYMRGINVVNDSGNIGKFTVNAPVTIDNGIFTTQEGTTTTVTANFISHTTNNAGTLIVSNGTFTSAATTSNTGGNLQITGGNGLFGDVVNAGVITISEGDLSSYNNGSPCHLTNNVGKIINIIGPGTIGVMNDLGLVTNNGIFNAGGGNVNVGNFTNNNNAALNVNLNSDSNIVTTGTLTNTLGNINVSKGILKSGNITNTAGNINITSGDLSSATGTPSTLSNAANQTINLSGTGTLGTNGPLGAVTNAGIFNIANNGMNVASVDNTATGILNINNGGVLAVPSATNSGVINLNTGGSLNTTVTFDTPGGILNIASGGIINSAIGGIDNTGSYGTVNFNGDFVYSGVGANVISNISTVNVNSGTLSINGSLGSALGIKNAFNIANNANVILNAGGNITGSVGFTKVDNLGTLTVNSGSNLGVPITFGPNGVLNLAGGSVTGVIGGVVANGGANLGKGTVNLSKSLIYTDNDSDISNIDYFNVNASELNINRPIAQINTAFSTSKDNTTTINAGGSISGIGSIYNQGILNVAGGTIGTGTGATAITTIGGITNSGTINVSNNVYVAGNISNSNGVSAVIGNNGSGIFATNAATPGTPADTMIGNIIVNNGGNIYRTGSTAELQNFGIVTVNSGGVIHIPVTLGDTGVLNLAGGTVDADITGGMGGAGTININNDFTYNTGANVISNINYLNINNSSNFIVDNSIASIYKAFNTALGTTTTVNTGKTLGGAGVLNNSGTINLDGTLAFAAVNNNSSGVLTINSTGSVSGGVINQSGVLNSYGDIGVSINFGSKFATLNILDGTVTGNITGFAGSNNNVINIKHDFTTVGTIDNVAAINVGANNFNINNNITNLSDAINLYGSTTTVNANKSISGTGVINNIKGILTVDGGKIGILTPKIPFGGIYNNGDFIIQNNGTVIVNSLVNGGTIGSTGVSSNPFNAYANINITVTQLALNIDLDNTPITNTIPGVQTTPENTDLIFSGANKNIIHITGMDDNGGTVQLNAAHGILTLANTTGLSDISGNRSNSLNISGSLSDLNAALQGLIFTPDPNYVGADANIQIITRNNQVPTSSSSDVAFTVPAPPYTPNVHVTKGILYVNNINNLGTITVSGAAGIGNNGDLSGVTAGTSTLNNAAGQIINITGAGTVGATNALGAVTNSGIINANGGNVTVGNFTNNNSSAALNISSGIIKSGNITNALGSINISGGDLSSVTAGTSTLTNAAGQTINITSTGTVGAANALGDVTNSGIINANGGNVTVGGFTNNHSSAALNISNGTIKSGNIANTLGNINIIGGNLSSISAGTLSTLTNASGQSVTVFESGAIGGGNGFGDIINNGIFNINGDVNIDGNFINNIGAVTNINHLFNLGLATNHFNNHGTVNVISESSITFGNYTVFATGTHVVSIDNNTHNPALLTLADGAAILQSGATIKIQNITDALTPNQKIYPIISGNSSIPGNSAPAVVEPNVNISGSTALLSYQIAASGNDVNIIANRNSILSVAEAAGNTAAYPVAAILDRFINTGGVTGEMRSALIKLDGLPTQQTVNEGVTQLLPDTSVTGDTGFASSSMVLSTIGERADLIARAGISNIQTGYSSGSMQSRNGFWLKGVGGLIDQKTKPTSVGYKANAVGVAFGIDDEVADDAWLGIGVSSVGTYINNKVSLYNKTRINSRQITLYGSYSPEDYYVDGFVAVAFNNYKIARGIIYNGLNQSAAAKYTAIQPSAKIANGYIWNVVNDFRIIPNWSLQYSKLKQNPYNETGAGNISLQQVTNSLLTQLEGGVGVKFSVLHNEDDQVYNPDLHFMVLHDFKSTAQVTTAKFLAGGGSFTITGAAPDKTTYNVGAGVTIVHKDRLNVTLNYDLRKKNKFIGHAGAIAVRYVF